jgi:hypothetical protein
MIFTNPKLSDYIVWRMLKQVRLKPILIMEVGLLAYAVVFIRYLDRVSINKRLHL